MSTNILLFLLPKKDVEYVLNTFTIRQTLEKMEFHHYSEIPVLDKEGKYVGSISDGDLLRVLKNNKIDWDETMKMTVDKVPVLHDIKPIQIDKNMLDLVSIIINQNFVPVIDDMEHFIGIITRKSVIEYMDKILEKKDN
ncbi:MAG: CBS domain-containing protein [Bacilli bacterium]|jgi:CBS domain-containing protein